MELLNGVKQQLDPGRWVYQIIVTSGTVTIQIGLGLTGTLADIPDLTSLDASTNGEIAIPVGAFLSATISDSATVNLAIIERP